MLHYFVKNPELGEFQRISGPQYKDVWIHVRNTTDHDIEVLGREVSLNVNILHDITDTNELPRIEYDGNDLYVFTRIPSKDKHGHVTTSPLLSVVTKDTFITLSREDSLEPSDLIQVSLKAKQDEQINLLINSIAHVVLTYETLIQQTGHSVKEIGRKLRTHEVTNGDFVRFVTIEDNLNEYQMNLNGLHAITERLSQNTHSSFHDSDTEALADMTLHIQQLCSAIASFSQMIVSIRNAYSTIANNTLNQRMKILTLLTVLIALPNVFYGMYGMNVALPFQNQSWAYLVITAFTILIVTVVFFLVKKFKVF
jgi:magnesium transporter